MASKVEGVVDGGMRAEHALNYVRRHGRGAVEPPLKRARRISTPIGSSCAARSIKVSEMTAYGAILPLVHKPAKDGCHSHCGPCSAMVVGKEVASRYRPGRSGHAAPIALWRESARPRHLYR